MNNRKLRSIIRSDMAAQGASRYRITAQNELHYYGKMPNTNQFGWYFTSFDPEAYVAKIVRGSRRQTHSEARQTRE